MDGAEVYEKHKDEISQDSETKRANLEIYLKEVQSNSVYKH